jgi:hypothetical protein
MQKIKTKTSIGITIDIKLIEKIRADKNILNLSALIEKLLIEYYKKEVKK